MIIAQRKQRKLFSARQRKRFERAELRRAKRLADVNSFWSKLTGAYTAALLLNQNERQEEKVKQAASLRALHKGQRQRRQELEQKIKLIKAQQSIEINDFTRQTVLYISPDGSEHQDDPYLQERFAVAAMGLEPIRTIDSHEEKTGQGKAGGKSGNALQPVLGQIFAQSASAKPRAPKLRKSFASADMDDDKDQNEDQRVPEDDIGDNSQGSGLLIERKSGSYHVRKMDANQDQSPEGSNGLYRPRYPGESDIKYAQRILRNSEGDYPEGHERTMAEIDMATELLINAGEQNKAQFAKWDEENKRMREEAGINAPDANRKFKDPAPKRHRKKPRPSK